MRENVEVEVAKNEPSKCDVICKAFAGKYKQGEHIHRDKLDAFYLEAKGMTQAEYDNPDLRTKARGRCNGWLRTRNENRSSDDALWPEYSVQDHYIVKAPPRAAEALKKLLDRAVFETSRARRNGSDDHHIDLMNILVDFIKQMGEACQFDALDITISMLHTYKTAKVNVDGLVTIGQLIQENKKLREDNAALEKIRELILGQENQNKINGGTE